MPVFKARRLDVDPIRLDPKTKPDPSEVWRLVGHKETLDRYEIDAPAGSTVPPHELMRVMRGRGAKTEEELRKPTNLKLDGKSTFGVRCVRTVYEPSEALAAECRNPVMKAERWEELRTQLINEAGAGVEQLAGTDRFAGAARVTGIGQGENAVVQVELIAFGAEGVGKDGKTVLVSPYANRKARKFEKAVATVADYLDKKFGGTEKTAEVEASEAEVEASEAEVEAPAVETEAPEAVAAPATEAPEAVAGPAREAAAVAGDARLPGLLSTPVEDSLGANIDVIGENAAENIRRRAQRKAKQHKLDRLPEEDLRRLLDSTENPFDKMPPGAGPDGKALSRWWADDGDRIVLRTAVEGTLAAKAEKEFADLAQREVARRGELSPNPLGAVRNTRGRKVAAEVGRRAAVRTGELASMPEKERMARTRELHGRIKDVGLKGADLEDVAESVALQNLRNAHNEHEAELLEREAQHPQRTVTKEPELAGAGMGV